MYLLQALVYERARKVIAESIMFSMDANPFSQDTKESLRKRLAGRLRPSSQPQRGLADSQKPLQNIEWAEQDGFLTNHKARFIVRDPYFPDYYLPHLDRRGPESEYRDILRLALEGKKIPTHYMDLKKVG
jgi:hypothetical protein